MIIESDSANWGKVFAFNIPDNDPPPVLSNFFESIPSSKLEYAYADGKWTPKELLLHLIDTERVFSIRALFFARSEDANLSGFDENIFAENLYGRTIVPCGVHAAMLIVSRK